MFTSFLLLVLGLLAMSTKKLISCSSCKEDHPPRGGQYCVYSRAAKDLCVGLGVSETEFLLHIDLEKISSDSKLYLLNPEPETEEISQDLIRKLVSENIANREQFARQGEQMDTLVAALEKLLTAPTPQVDSASSLGEVTGKLDFAGKGNVPVTTNNTESATDRLLKLISAKVDPVKTEPVLNSNVFQKVSQLPNNPVLQKHTAATHFTPLVHGHKPRSEARDRRDDYYDDLPPRDEYRAADRRKRRLQYFDLDIHMAFDSKTTDFRTFEDILSANLSLVDSLITQGYSVSCYLKHIRFLVDKSKVYTANSLIRYDQAVRERADVLGEATMVYGDHELVHRFLGPENLKPRGKPTSSFEVKSNPRNETKKKLPVGVCWKWNFGRKCAANCSLKHICTDCFANHRSIDCSSTAGQSPSTTGLGGTANSR